MEKLLAALAARGLPPPSLVQHGWAWWITGSNFLAVWDLTPPGTTEYRFQTWQGTADGRSGLPRQEDLYFQDVGPLVNEFYGWPV